MRRKPSLTSHNLAVQVSFSSPGTRAQGRPPFLTRSLTHFMALQAAVSVKQKPLPVIFPMQNPYRMWSFHFSTAVSSTPSAGPPSESFPVLNERQLQVSFFRLAPKFPARNMSVKRLFACSVLTASSSGRLQCLPKTISSVSSSVRAVNVRTFCANSLQPIGSLFCRKKLLNVREVQRSWSRR